MADGSERVRGAFRKAEDVAPIESGGAPPSPPEADGEAEQFRKCALFPLNDFGNGQRFSAYYGQDVMFVPRVAWFCWDGKVWGKDDDKLNVRGLAQKVAARIIDEAAHVSLEDWEIQKLEEEPRLIDLRDEIHAKGTGKTPDDVQEEIKIKEKLDWIARIKRRRGALRADHRKHAKASGNSAKITNMILESTVKQSLDLEALDADPLVINTQSGVLKFEVDRAMQKGLREDGCSDMDGSVSMELLPHAREMRLTKIMDVQYDAAATCPKFDAFMAQIHPDPEIRAFLQRWYGLSMTGLTGEQKLVFQYGDGSNGKSVLADLMANMMADYSATAAIESLTGTQKRSGGEATPDLIPLIGARMVRASEPEEGERLREAEIKKMTGGEPMQMRANYGDTIEVLPQFKLTISGNHKPEIRGTDNGIWRRILLVKFGVIIPDDKQDLELPEKLWEERSGVLNWLIAGLTQYLESGLQEPQSVLAETRAYREESDPVGAFFGACCEFAADAPFMKSAELMKAFKLWQEIEGQSVWTPGTITKRISSRAEKYRDPRTGLQFQKHKSSVSGYLGIRLTKEHSQALDEYDAKQGKL